MNEFLVPLWLGELGVWIGILLSLALFSLLLRDNGAARLAQHILVGAGMGYAVVLAARDLFWHQYLRVLLRSQSPDLTAWAAAALLVVIGTVVIGRIIAGDSAMGASIRRWTWIGLVPVAISVGFAAAAVAVGVVQGTLAPQFLRAASTGLQWDAPPLQSVTGLIMLAATTGALIHVHSRPDRDWRRMPAPLRGLLGAWAGIGKRALWLAAGVIFARLLVSRISLLAGQLQWLGNAVTSTRLWSWLAGIL